MNQYSDIKIIEANRLHSEEAKGGNNENFSLWTNNLQDILLLEPDDKVSVYGAFVSERGAGQPGTVEIKGVPLDEKKLFQYIEMKNEILGTDRLNNDLPSGGTISRAIFKQETHELRDDTLQFVINYYIPSRCTNSLHLPRRWMYNEPLVRQNFVIADNRTAQGVSLTYPDKSNTSLTNLLYNKKAFYKCIKNGNNENILKPNNDNAKYTLLVRNETYFTEQGLNGSELPTIDMRDPENATYQIYRELKKLTIPAGFNSPDFIATEISRQMQAIINDEIVVQDNTGDDAHPVGVSKILESETYKAFYSGNIEDNSKQNFLDYFSLTGSGNTAADKQYQAGHLNGSGFQWLRQYQFVATKYPELYEKGRLLNRDKNGVYKGIKGATTKNTTILNSVVIDKNFPIELDIPYGDLNNKDRVNEFKAFFDAQKLYPEILSDLAKSGNGYNASTSINNCRWVHINRFDYEKQSLAGGVGGQELENTQLGWGGYYEPRSYIPPTTAQLMSLLLTIYFDPLQAETYYENPDITLDQFTYGCIGKSNGNIAIYPWRSVNGIDSGVWDELKTTLTSNTGTIEQGRKIGFDLHFNAPGMFYMLPLSGWASRPNPNSSVSEHLGNWAVPDVQENRTITGTKYDMNPWKKLLYIGADNPSLEWDGTNFAFSNFHTCLNRGNVLTAGNPIFPTSDPVDPDAGDEVYKIHPKDLANDWTPDRTPYSFDDYQIYSGITNPATIPIRINRVNDNYEKWRIYDALCGIMIEDFGVPEHLWTRSLWGLLGFSYKQFHGTNNRLVNVQRGSANDLSVLSTNAEVVEGDTKIFSTNWAGTPMYNNMITTPANIWGYLKDHYSVTSYNQVYPIITHKTTSITVIADNLPTRMIRGYYTIRSNILEGTPFIGGKVNNTNMPIIGIVDKINGDGDFYFGQESSLQFTITKPVRLASLSISIHDPDGSYARTSEQSTILFKVQKPVVATFNVAEEIMQDEKNKK